MNESDPMAPAQDEDAGSIAIVGLAGRFPGARSAAELWSLLREGKEATQWLSDEELSAAGVPAEDLQDPEYVRASLVLPDMEMFDAEFFGFSQARRRDPRSAAPAFPRMRMGGAGGRRPPAGELRGRHRRLRRLRHEQSYLTYNLLTNPELVQVGGSVPAAPHRQRQGLPLLRGCRTCST